MALKEGRGRIGYRMLWPLSGTLPEFHVYVFRITLPVVVEIKSAHKQRPIDRRTLTVPVISRGEK